CAAQARARPWLPAECVPTPARRCSVSSIATALLAPRSLKAPVGCKVSGLSRNGGFSTGPAVKGVRTTSPSIRAAAARTASAVTRLIRGVCPPLTPVHGVDFLPTPKGGGFRNHLPVVRGFRPVTGRPVAFLLRHRPPRPGGLPLRSYTSSTGRCRQPGGLDVDRRVHVAVVGDTAPTRPRPDVQRQLLLEFSARRAQ